MPEIDPTAERIPLILASGSPRRREILRAAGVEFEIVPPVGVDESASTGPAEVLARSLAAIKAEAVIHQLGVSRRHPPPCRVLAADTVVAAPEGGRETILGKPVDPQDARSMLRLLSGRTHAVWTGIALAVPGETIRLTAERSEVQFRELDDAVIEEYVRSGEPMDKAGAYGIQGRGEALVAGFRGCFLNIVGLPLVRVLRLLALEPATKPACPCAVHPLQQEAPGCAPGG